MYCLYQCNELERNLSGTYNVLCYIYIEQIAKGRISPVYALNMLKSIWSCCYVESKHRTCAYLCHLSNIVFQYVTQNSKCTRQNTLYVIILELTIHIIRRT